MDLSKDEHIIAEALLDARKVQEYLWQELSMQNDKEYLPHTWGVFQKRVNKIMEIDINHPHSIVELRKRVLQQAALSIVAIKVLDNIKNKENGSV